MKREIRDSEYAALAELRYRIRQFLRGSDLAAEGAGLEPQQYQMLLTIRSVANPNETSIRRLAERLALRHHSAVGLIDRLEAHGYVRRIRNGRDQREVCVILLPSGQRALDQVVCQRLGELRGNGHALVAAINAILKHTPAAHSRRNKLRAPGQRQRQRPKPSHRSRRAQAAKI